MANRSTLGFCKKTPERYTLRPSASARWLRCPGSAILSVEDEDSEYAKKGRVLHDLAAHMLITGKDLAGVENILCLTDEETGHTVDLVPDDKDKVAEYVEIVRAMAGEAVIFIEQRVQIGEGVSDGTSDAFFIRPEGLFVYDLKTGRKLVPADNNSQLSLYAKGVINFVERIEGELADDFPVHLIISQPFLGKVDEFKTTVGDIKDFWENMVQPAVGAIKNLNRDRALARAATVPGNVQCWYCQHRARCKSLERLVVDNIIENCNDVEHLPDTTAFEHAKQSVLDYSLEHLANLIDLLPIIERWVKSVREEVYKRAMAGEIIPGYKLVEGKLGNRAWKDEEIVKRTLKSMKVRKADMFVEKLISPTQAEKLLGKDKYKAKVGNLVDRPDGKPALVPLSDKRPALDLNEGMVDENKLDDLI